MSQRQATDMTLTRKWSLLAVIVIVALFVASWFLLIAPKRGQVTDLKTQVASQDSKNSALVQQLSQLQAQSQDLPKQKAQLAVFRTQIPDNPALPSMIRDLSAAAKKSG